jgi:hypothetical protein
MGGKEGKKRSRGKRAYEKSYSGSAWKNGVAGESVLVRMLVVESVGDGSLDVGEVGLVGGYSGGASPGATKRNAGAAPPSRTAGEETWSNEGHAGEF